MENLELLFALLFGALIGSFLNVVAVRVPAKESIVTPGSHCPSCKAPIVFYDNIPVLSWLILRGRCRSCGQKISIQYPLVELLTALLFLTVVAVNGVDRDLLLTLPFVALMTVVSVVDIRERIVPNSAVLFGFLWGLVALAIIDPGQLLGHLLAALIAGGALLIISLVYPAGMGMGDVKLTAVIGLYLGSAVAPALLIAFLLGSVIGIATVIKQGAVARKQAVPFAPFLATGGITALFIGTQIVDWYLDSFF